jgi:hypothetical protein
MLHTPANTADHNPPSAAIQDGRLLFQYSIMIDQLFTSSCEFSLPPNIDSQLYCEDMLANLKIELENPQASIHDIINSEDNHTSEVLLTPAGDLFKSVDDEQSYIHCVNDYCDKIKYLNTIGISYKAHSESKAFNSNDTIVAGPIRPRPIL